MTDHPALRSDRGFTLLEITIAMFVLAVGILGMAAVQITAIKANSYGAELTTATLLAENHIERLINDETDCPANDTLNGTLFTINCTITQNSPQNGVTTLAVTITWNDKYNVVRNITLTTLTADL